MVVIEITASQLWAIMGNAGVWLVIFIAGVLVGHVGIPLINSAYKYMDIRINRKIAKFDLINMITEKAMEDPKTKEEFEKYWGSRRLKTYRKKGKMDSRIIGRGVND